MQSTNLQVPNALHHMPALKSIDLSSNVIGVLNRESFQGLPKLEALRIAKNELSRMEEGAFKEAPRLRHLVESLYQKYSGTLNKFSKEGP